MKKSKYEIRFLQIAEEDFAEIISYIAMDSPKSAAVLAEKVIKEIEVLSYNPKLGRVPSDEDIKILGYRYLIVRNYIVFYTIEDDKIFIHRILHGARNYKELL